jgi:chromosomal replication initiator protein
MGKQEDLAIIWEHVVGSLRLLVSADTYQRWFDGVQLVEANETDMALSVPNNIYQVWIESNYMPQLQAAVIESLGCQKEIRFQVRDERPAASAGVAVAVPAKVAEPKREPSKMPEGLNPRNTFDLFVVGANNQFAHAASLAVAQAPSRTYNPLFVYGGVGLGKTHLMQAVGHFIGHNKKGSKVHYLSSEQFTNEFIDAIQNSTLVKFRKRYRQADVLLIDDIQFLGGKERSQEEFFHTFNTLFDGHKQIVLSSDRPPSEISNLEQRLVSRFEWGLTAELQPPDVETRMAILKKKAEAMAVQIGIKTLEFIAQRIRSNIRRLEGALLRVASLMSLRGGEVSTDEMERVLKDILQEEGRQMVTIGQIQRRVAEHYDIRVADMTSKRRPQNIAFPRQVAMFLARELTKSSLSEIGEAFGGRDHGTVIHAHRLVKERSGKEDGVRQTISFLESQINRGG